MRKGIFFSVETMYLLAAVFAIVVATLYFLPSVSQPNYDFVSALKVAHDMGQSNVSAPPLTPDGSGGLSSNYVLGDTGF